MYVPKIFLAPGKEELIAFMKRYSFATIITAKDNFPAATHLPFNISTRGDELVLTSHFAKANGQWTEIENNDKILVIFSEPHAYISPRNYEKELNVPTWNYISVHAYGYGKLITEIEPAFAVLEQTIETYEIEYKQQWDRLPQDYRLKMLKGIVAFEIVITDLQGKMKLSQNRTEAEQLRIIKTLSTSFSDNEKQIARYMQENTGLPGKE